MFDPTARLDRGNAGKLETSKSSDDGCKQGSEEAVAEASEQRAEASNQTGEKASKEANEEGQNLSDKAENRGKQRVQLRAKAKDSNEGADGGEDLADENVDEGDDGVEVSLADVEAGRVGELLDEVLQDLLDLLELRGRLGGGIIGGDITGLGALSELLYNDVSLSILNCQSY
jgi:hypothetical protein